MHPRAREALAGGLRLGALVLVVREDQVEAAAVHVEVLAELRARHGRALDVPAGPPSPPGRVPGRVLVRLVGLPEREVERRALALAGLDAGAGDQLVGPLARELAVRRIGLDAEVDVAVGGRVGRAALDQPLDQRDDLGDRLARERLGVGPPEPEPVGVGAIRVGHPAASSCDGTPCCTAAV